MLAKVRPSGAVAWSLWLNVTTSRAIATTRPAVAAGRVGDGVDHPLVEQERLPGQPGQAAAQVPGPLDQLLLRFDTQHQTDPGGLLGVDQLARQHEELGPLAPDHRHERGRPDQPDAAFGYAEAGARRGQDEAFAHWR